MTEEVQPKCHNCGCTDGLTWTADPYAHEIYDDDTEYWFCESCLYESFMEV